MARSSTRLLSIHGSPHKPKTVSVLVTDLKYHGRNKSLWTSEGCYECVGPQIIFFFFFE